MRSKTYTGPSLPESILDQIKENDEKHGHKKSSLKYTSRKAARKQERSEKKQRKVAFYSTSSNKPTKKRVAESEHSDSPKHKKAKIETSVTTTIEQKKLPHKASDRQESKKKDVQAPGKSALKLKQPKSQIVKPEPRSQVEKQEDDYIAYLERQLGHSGSRKGKSKAVGDGLDDLFDFASTLSIPRSASQALVDPEELEAFSEASQSQDDDEEFDDDSEEEWGGIAVEDDASSGGSSSDQDEEGHDSQPDPKVSNTGRYVPPHLRNVDASEPESETQLKLRRKLKGLLNRMSEQNIESILESIEEIYRDHRRHEVTSTLTSLIIEGTSSHSSLLDSFVLIHAALIASLHKIIGIEFAAHFVQTLISTYEQHYDALCTLEVSNTDETKGKECSNLIVMLSELYNFQVVSCVLVFDIIRGLLAKSNLEFNIELLLKIVRNSGQQLRQDDPSALKDIIQIVQDKMSMQDEKLSSRTAFMMETLTNLKNNKVKRNNAQNSGNDTAERMKKFLTSIGKKRHVSSNEPLRISLDDLHSAEKKGKWWLVGAAWAGDPLTERQQLNKDAPARVEQSGENVLLTLAKKQGMNTDIRRSIFVVLLSSEDYVDACERLSQLNLSEIQQREIIRVILHCCGNEKSYNPFYTLVGQHLCQNTHAHKVTLQYCLWDFLRELGETKVGGVEVVKGLGEDDNDALPKKMSATRTSNLARAYAWWLAKDSLNLTILKPIDFTSLKQPSRSFLKEMFIQLFISSQVTSPIADLAWSKLNTIRNRDAVRDIFTRANRIEVLSMGLVYFLSETFKLKDDEEGYGADKERMLRWASDAAKETLRAGIDGTGI